VLAAFALSLLALGKHANPAVAATTPFSSSSFATGFSDSQLTVGSESRRTLGLRRAVSLGSRFVRLYANWTSIAPAQRPPGFDATKPGDPAYNWSVLDGAVRDASAAGVTILLQLIYAPAWAQGNPPPGALPNVWQPDPAALGAFARAVAARYSGSFPDPSHPGVTLPRVSYFQVWNEPNLSKYLEPQWGRTGNGAIVPLSPSIYRRMVNAVYTNVKSVQSHAVVILAGQAPYGGPPGSARMTPVAFLRNLLCLSGTRLRPAPCQGPAHFDGFDHHPYGAAPTAHAGNLEDVALPDLNRLTQIVNVARRTGRALPSGPKPLWVTEWGFDSSPPERTGLSLSGQARFLSRGLYELWRQRVRYAAWFLLFDDPQGEVGFKGSGVYFSRGRAKPSSAAFAFPFVALPLGGGRVLVWGLPRQQGPVTIQQWTRGGWRAVAQLRSTRQGILYARVPLGAHLTLRARMGSRTSPAWATG
jgi:hypothetical protein